MSTIGIPQMKPSNFLLPVDRTATISSWLYCVPQVAHSSNPSLYWNLKSALLSSTKFYFKSSNTLFSSTGFFISIDTHSNPAGRGIYSSFLYFWIICSGLIIIPSLSISAMNGLVSYPSQYSCLFMRLMWFLAFFLRRFDAYGLLTIYKACLNHKVYLSFKSSSGDFCFYSSTIDSLPVVTSVIFSSSGILSFDSIWYDDI